MTDKILKQKVNPKSNIGENNSPIPNIAVSTSFSKQKYLFAYAAPAEIQNHIRTQAHEDESKRLPEIIKKWQSIQSSVNKTLQTEAGLAEKIDVQDIPTEFKTQIDEIQKNSLFQKTFSSFNTYFALVEIDKLIVPQRVINLEYVKKLHKDYPAKPNIKNLIDICLSPTRDVEPVQHLELPAVSPVHVFSSKNIDLRFLGSAIKHLTPDDLEYAQGGLPAAAIITFVGYGAASVNAYQAGNRIILNNGTHRVYALRSLGVTHIPIAIQKVIDPSTQFPPNLLGIPSQYLLGHIRPALMKDFLSEDFTITINVPNLIQTVSVGVSINQHGIPT